jgi:hypothetical protein
MQEIYNTIDLIIQAQKKARRANDYLTLMTNAEALLEFIPKLITYSINQEGEYRKYEAKLSLELTDNKRNSNSFCETQSKATLFYAEWQKSKLFIEFIYEMIQMSKKLAGGVSREFNAG